MRKYLLVLIMGILLLGSELTASAETKTIIGDFLKEKNINIEVSATTDYYSKYIWRGIKLDDDPVIQTGLTLSGYGVELTVWSSFDVDPEDAIDSDETDTIITYTHNFNDLNLFGQDLDTFSVTVGHIYYDFSGSGLFSKEAMLAFAYDTFLSPSLTWYHDYSRESQGGGKGDYLVLDLSKSFDLNKDHGITLDTGGHVGYNKRLFINGEGGDLGFKLGLSIPLTSSLVMAPNINYSIPFGDLEDSDDGNYEDKFFWGVGFSYAL